MKFEKVNHMSKKMRLIRKFRAEIKLSILAILKRAKHADKLRD
jgi:hypothetical protein